MQDLHGFFSIFFIDKDMIMVIGCDDIAADPRLGQRFGEGGRQPYCLQGGMNGEGDPGRDE